MIAFYDSATGARAVTDLCHMDYASRVAQVHRYARAPNIRYASPLPSLSLYRAHYNAALGDTRSRMMQPCGIGNRLVP